MAMQLESIENGGEYIGVVQREGSNGARLKPRDARFLTEVVSGVTRWRRRLDFIIDSLAMKEVKPSVLRQILRLGTVIFFCRKPGGGSTLGSSVGICLCQFHFWFCYLFWVITDWCGAVPGMYEILEMGAPSYISGDFVELAKLLLWPDAGRIVNGRLTA
jgi:NusB family